MGKIIVKQFDRRQDNAGQQSNDDEVICGSQPKENHLVPNGAITQLG